MKDADGPDPVLRNWMDGPGLAENAHEPNLKARRPDSADWMEKLPSPLRVSASVRGRCVRFLLGLGATRARPRARGSRPAIPWPVETWLPPSIRSIDHCDIVKAASDQSLQPTVRRGRGQPPKGGRLTYSDRGLEVYTL